MISDILATVLAFTVSYYLRAYLAPIQPFGFYLYFMIFGAISLPASFLFFRLYDKNSVLLSLSYLVDFIKALVLWGFLLIAFSFFGKTDYSRVVLILFFFAASFFIYLWRFFVLWRSSVPTNNPGDPEIYESVKNLLKVFNVSSDGLAFLEGQRLRKSTGLVYYAVKRMLDIIFSLLGILIAFPFFPLITYLIKKDSDSSAIISQERIGLNGKKFILYKFRTMKIDTPLYASAPRKDNDSRVTKFGKFLRKYSLDELPQLWNVLKGEMSIVGPRPEMPFIVEKYEPWQKIRLEVKPGITGLWQILGRKDIPLEENIEYDIYYVYNQSFFLDLAIILKTLPHLLFPRGSY